MAWISFLLQMWIASTVLSVDVTIVTNPRQGPFRLRQQYQFSCVVEPTPPEPVTYQWRYIEEAYSSSTTGQTFNRTYYYSYTNHYCYYFCEVSANQTLIGSAKRIIEVQGFVYTEEPVVRSFSSGGRLVLNVNISDYYTAQFINSLAWYHNGTKLFSGDKYRITNNATTLSVSDMAESDAGVYDVKIDSLTYYYYYGTNEDPNCDSSVLPLLESLAAHAPVTFTVQEHYLPEYDPHSIVSAYYITESDVDSYSVDLHVRGLSNVSFSYVGAYWYRNGNRLNNGDVYNITTTNQDSSLRVMSNSTADIVGDYVGILTTYSFSFITVRYQCRNYYYYIEDEFFRLPLKVTFWSVIRPPSSVLLDIGDPVLTELESTAVECTAVDMGGEPTEAFLTLWWNEELIAHVNGSHLSYSTSPYPYGTYRCSAGDIHNTSILFERANFQLLLDVNSQLCQQNQQADSLGAALSEVFRSLCQSCDDVYPSNIVDVQLNCSASGRLGYLTAGLVYSSSDGRITASTLSSMLTVWLLSEGNPSILVDGTTVGLSKQCPTQLNAITQSGCIQLLTSDSESTSLVGHMAGLFAAGLATGVLITVFVIALIFIVRKLKVRAAAPQQPAADKSADIAMGTNQAYESVDTRYQAGRLGRIPAQEDEVIYELPTV